MQYSYTIGIDISKQRLDWQCANEQGAIDTAQQHPNTLDGIEQMIASWEPVLSGNQVLVCFEHTGVYGWILALLLEQRKISYVMVPAIQVQRSMGLQRGKSDPIDARRLAEFAFLYQRQLMPFTMPSAAVLELRTWLVWREHLVKARAGLIRTGKGFSCLPVQANPDQVIAQIQQTREQLTQSIAHADHQIQQVIHQQMPLLHPFDLLRSIPGIGWLTAAWLLVYTHGFSRFEHARQFTCYVGVAPFPNQSGITAKPARVSRYRCGRLKGLLYNGAHSAVRYDPELAKYFSRKTKEGKHPQSVMNAVVCKMIYRAFAVIKRGTPYVNTYQQNVSST